MITRYTLVDIGIMHILCISSASLYNVSLQHQQTQQQLIQHTVEL